ncbi:MAG: methionyl-tRNA formyltransferase [Candidatus Sulfobium sp.]|jgi:methionyl-tRNA formyltransferase
MRVIFFGTPDFAVPSLKVLVEAGEDIVAVVTRPDRAKGRGRKLTAPPVKELAQSRGLRVMQPAAVGSQAFAEELSSLDPDVIAVVAYGRIIPPSILRLPPLGCVNVHASLLPKYRGAAPVQRAIINGEKKTGVTTMLMDEGLDTGGILLQEETEISSDENAGSLGARLSVMGASLLSVTLEGLKNGTVKPFPQAGEPTYAPPLKKEDGGIDWSLPAERLSDLIRGTYPWPGAYCSFQGERVTILRASVAEGGHDCAPGAITGISAESICTCTGRGILRVLELKPRGKKAMSAGAFIRGRHAKEGASFDGG